MSVVINGMINFRLASSRLFKVVFFTVNICMQCVEHVSELNYSSNNDVLRAKFMFCEIYVYICYPGFMR